MKKLLAIILILAMLPLTACGRSNQAEESASVPTVAPVSTEAPTATQAPAPTEEPVPNHYPITVTDHAGREVIIGEEPQKLVSGYYISTSLLIALELDEKLVGIEAKANKRAIYKLAAPELIDLPSVGTAKEFDLEGCAALEPDLVILPLKLKSAVETLESLGINVLLVNPENQELLTDMIHMISAATNTEKRAAELLGFTSAQEQYLADTLTGAQTPSVYLAGNSDMLSTAGNAMYQSDMIRLAGGVNVAADIEDTYWVEINYEQLLTWNPDYIILASDATYTADDVMEDPNLAACTAVVNGNVYQLPNKAEAWDSPVPSGILGALWLANVLHNDLLTDTDFNEKADEYYETFYDFTYSQN